MMHATGLLSLIDMVRKTKLQLMLSLLGSSNEVIEYVSAVLRMSTTSSFFSTIRDIQLLYGVSFRDSSWTVSRLISDFVSTKLHFGE